MRLIAFELRKLFSSKVTLGAMFFVLVLTVGVSIYDAIEWRDYVGDIQMLNKKIQQHEGKIEPNLAAKLTQKFERKSNEAVDGYESIDKNLTIEEKINKIFESNYYGAVKDAKRWNYSKYESVEDPSSTSGLERLCLKLESEGKQESYLYKDTLKNLSMRKYVGEPGYYNVGGWGTLFGFLEDLPGIIFISLILIIVLAPIFSNERSNGMETIILSTKMGRHKIVLAKIAASLIFTIIWVALFYTLHIVAGLTPYGALAFKDIPLNTFMNYTPYNLTAVQALAISYVITILSACVLATIFCFISALQKNNLVSIILALLVVFAPISITNNGQIAKMLMLFPTITMSGNTLFSNYHSFNILNTPVLYPVLASILLIISLPLIILLTFKVYNRKVKA